MPRLTLAEITENNCRACYYFQGVSLWCCRFRCVKYNTPIKQPASGRKRIKIINPGKAKAEINAANRDAKIMPLYEKGLTDREIANALGIKSKSNVCTWRKSKGLPPNVSYGHSLTPAGDQRRRDVYAATNTDSQAAAIIGISAKAFCDWRNARGLQPKYRN